MALQYPSEWKFSDSGISIPELAAGDLRNLILEIDYGDKDLIEDFKSSFGNVGYSTSYDWALTDLEALMSKKNEQCCCIY